MGNKTLFLCMAALAAIGWPAQARGAKHQNKIPFKLYRNHLVVVKGTIGRIENRNLLIDTGASPTVVDEALVHDLGLKAFSHLVSGMSVVGGEVATYYSILQSLDLGPVHREAIPVAVQNLSLMQAQIGVRIDAIIGLDAIAPTNFEIDYESGRVKFGSLRTRSAVRLSQTTPFAIITAKVNGRPLNLAIDTGSSELVLFRDHLPEPINKLSPAREVQLSNVGGDTLAPEVQLGDLRVGDVDLSGSMAVLTTVPRCCEFDGLLGISGLHFKRITFDFEKRILGLELADHPAFASEGQGTCGIGFGSDSCRNGFLSPANHP